MMIEIILRPNLSSCIETVAKREYEGVLNLLLSIQQEDQQLLDKLELLRVFLETADFRELRSRTEDLLAAGKLVECALKSIEADPKYEIEIRQF